MTSSKTSSDSNFDASSKIKHTFDNAIPSASQRLPTEILEIIFLHCDFRTIFLIQSVSASWRNAITGSSKIQEKLFLFPILQGRNQRFLRWMTVTPPPESTDPNLMTANCPVVTHKSSDTTPQQLIVQINPLATDGAMLKLDAKVKFMMDFEMDPKSFPPRPRWELAQYAHNATTR
ncbi:hypothetical protein LTR78_000701 [Recurvomyces mirabilis]|uniref:F-box domain-containing protein n=1 Tax=Recurvomyces mirabilis TaxID=574656 RepID=A0AAE0WX03_9PEZI|nr:hypothetical protein LTR78_000701 [Recurvomyces mirabilis]KAK5158671.1 hypothetical protein LTS14_002779 [Recurvomyces mirabilis]